MASSSKNSYLADAQQILGQPVGGYTNLAKRRQSFENRLMRSVDPRNSVGSYNNQKLAQYTSGNARQAYTDMPKAFNADPVSGLNKEKSEVQLGAEGLKDRISAGNDRLMNFAQLEQRRRKAEERKRRLAAAQQNQQGMYQGGGGRVPTSYGGKVVVIDGKQLGEVAPGKYLRKDAAGAFRAMATAFAKAGMGNLGVTAGFRSNARQAYLYRLYKSGRGNLAAPPGKSLHQSGIAVDLNGYGGSTRSKQFQWLLANASKYGFSWANGRRYGEPWHWEYVG